MKKIFLKKSFGGESLSFFKRFKFCLIFDQIFFTQCKYLGIHKVQVFPFNSMTVKDIKEGEIFALLGPNGAGKSTLIRCLLGLETISNGTINLFGNEIQNVKNRNLRLVRCRVGVVFQKHNLVPRLSVLSNVIHGALGRNTQSVGSFLSGIRLWSHTTADHLIREKALECL